MARYVYLVIGLFYATVIHYNKLQLTNIAMVMEILI